jgi:hypothetical protein
VKRYKVVAFGGHDGLAFDELLVKFSGGYMLPLKVKQGEYIPLQVLDPMDVEKSLLVGSLGRYLKGGQVVIEEDDEPKKPKDVQEASRIAKANTKAAAKKNPAPAEPISEPEPIKAATPPPPVSGPETMLENISQVKVEDDFYKLGFFMKVKFIENCSDKALLMRLLEKTKGSHQLQTNIQLKLASLR